MTTLLGRRRPIPELRASNRQTRSLGERLAVNTVMQGTAADVIKVAMIRTTGCAPRAGQRASCSRCTTSCCSRCPEPRCRRLGSSCALMFGAYPLDPPLAVEVGVGDNWGRRVKAHPARRRRVTRGQRPGRGFSLRRAGFRPASPARPWPTQRPSILSVVPVLEDGVWIGPDGELIPDYDATFPTINEGEVVHGTVVRVDKDEVLVDIGYKSEGVIPVSELSIRRSVNPADEVSVGEEIDALVMTKEDAEGRLILSKKRARFELAWKAIEAAAESGEAVNGRVIEVVKGGLILDLGVRGFLPASLVDIRRVQDLDEFTGKELRCKVIELNRSRNNVVLSRRAVLEDERKVRGSRPRQASAGRVVDGQISQPRRLRRVRRPRRDGWADPHLRALLEPRQPSVRGARDRPDRREVKVLDIDRERQRLARSRHQSDLDLAAGDGQPLTRRDVVEGRVTKVVPRGVRGDPPRVEGARAHLSSSSSTHVENPRESSRRATRCDADPRDRR